MSAELLDAPLIQDSVKSYIESFYDDISE